MFFKWIIEFILLLFNFMNVDIATSPVEMKMKGIGYMHF